MASAEVTSPSSVKQVTLVTPSPSQHPNCGDAVHIASAALHAYGVAAHKLVFGMRHRCGRVLCDGTGSARPGHTFVRDGRPLPMSSYCAEPGGCAQVVTWVSTPKLVRGWRMTSWRRELYDTAFAVQF